MSATPPPEAAPQKDATSQPESATKKDSAPQPESTPKESGKGHKWDTAMLLKLALVVHKLNPPITPKWDLVAAEMGPNFTSEAVRQRFQIEMRKYPGGPAKPADSTSATDTPSAAAKTPGPKRAYKRKAKTTEDSAEDVGGDSPTPKAASAPPKKRVYTRRPNPSKAKGKDVGSDDKKDQATAATSEAEKPKPSSIKKNDMQPPVKPKAEEPSYAENEF